MTGIRRLLSAWVVAALVFLHLPVAVLAVSSLNASRFGATWTGFTLDWYAAAFADVALRRALANSLAVALATTVISVVLGTGGAWLLHRYRFAASRLWRTLALVPMLVPEVVLGAGLLVLFAAARFELGFASTVVSHATLCFPFVMVAVQARLDGLDPSLEEAAMDLGATPALAFRRVLVPCLVPAVASGALLAFSLSLDEVIVTSFTAGASSRTLPLEVLGRVRKGIDPSLNAVSTAFVALSALLVLASSALRGGDRSAA